MAAACGPSASESCCASLLVPGGTFNRSNDQRYPATVSDFWLDRFEITVGRFRAFVNAGKGTQIAPPAPGDGAHPLISGSGWDSSWNADLKVNMDELDRWLRCNFGQEAWSAPVGLRDNDPISCITWYEAFAFCAWDGGRLPTDAEWNYATAGGSEQRLYPWGSAPPDESYAVYCVNSAGSCRTTRKVGSKSPKGDGRWGHADLQGNVSEWNLDRWMDYYPMPCDNCAALDVPWYRVVRGADVGSSAAGLVSIGRNREYPEQRGAALGARCARNSP